MKKEFEKYGEVRYITAEEWVHLNYNPYRFSEGYSRSKDGMICEIYSCGNESKKMNIPQHIAVEP